MKDKDNNEKKLMAPWDISRAPFMSKAQRDLYVEPPKDQQLPGDTEPMVGKLMRSMYGTQDASQIFQKDYIWSIYHRRGQLSVLCAVPFFDSSPSS